MGDVNCQSLQQPVVMSFSVLDPSGSSGLLAEAQACASMGCHCAGIATALTTQNTQASPHLRACDSSLLVEQARSVLEDMPVKAFMIGIPGDIKNVEAIHTILRDYPDVPVILAPQTKLAASMGQEALGEALNELLTPLASLLIISDSELQQSVAGADTHTAAAMALLSQGCTHLLVTSTFSEPGKLTNRLYGNHRALENYTWDRLDGPFTGAQSTLAAALAALIAQGQDVLPAAHAAQQYTWQSLRHASHLGMGKMIPNRLFWADQER